MGDLESVGVGIFGRIVEATWQASVLAMLVLAVQWVLRKRLSAQWRYALWGIVVIRLLLPALPPSPSSMYSIVKPSDIQQLVLPAASPQENEARRLRPDLETAKPLEEVDGQEPLFTQRSASSSFRDRARQTPPVGGPAVDARIGAPVAPSKPLELAIQSLPWVWALGACLLIAFNVFRGIRCLRQVRKGRVIEDAITLEILGECKTVMGIRRSVALVESAMVKGPALCGWGSPRILVPPGLLVSMPRGEMRHVLLHELAHLRRRDLWVSQLLSLLAILHWFNPLLSTTTILRGQRQLKTASGAG